MSHRRVLLAGLCWFVGLTAISGGAVLLWKPDGSIIRMPVSELQYSPFSDFFVPGLLLAGIVGGVNAVAAFLVQRKRAHARVVALVAGGSLATWIIVEMILLRAVHWLQLVYLVLALAISSMAGLGKSSSAVR